MCDISAFCFGRAARERTSEYQSARRVQTQGTPPRSAALVAEPLVAGAAAQVVARPGEQAGVKRSLGRQPGVGVAAAERLGHRRDHADLTAAVSISVTACNLP